MKKLFAILLVAFLAVNFAFAADAWGPESRTGEFIAKVHCTPQLQSGNQTIQLGHFWQTATNALTTNNGIAWTLTGSPTMTYTISYNVTIPQNAPILTVHSYLGTNANFAWTGKLGDLPTSPYEFVGSQAGVNCSTPISFGLDVTNVDASNSPDGSYTWTLTYSVSANF